MTDSTSEEFQLLRALKVLGVDANLSVDDLKKAYHRLCKVWHPDRFPGDPELQREANIKLAEINNAYEYAFKILSQREARKRQAEEAARKKRDAEEAQGRNRAESQRRAGEAKAAEERKRKAAEEFDKRVAHEAEALASSRLASYRRKSFGLSLLAVAIAGLIGFSISANQNAEAFDSRGGYDEGYAAGKAYGERVSAAAGTSAASDAYDRGFDAGKRSAKPTGKYIRMDHPDFRYDAGFKKNAANTWYVISLIKNPESSERSFAPYVIDAYYVTGKSGPAKQIRTSSLPSGWWSYTSRKKR